MLPCVCAASIKPTELKTLRRTVDEKWPALEGAEAIYWIDRWRRSVSPYSRVRAHAIRLQLDAIIALALDCGLRRNEILALTENWMHYDNLGVVVWQPPGPWKGPHREIPYTARARKAIRAWSEFRTLIGPQHDSPWLNLWAEETIRQPLRPDTFNRLLRTYIGSEWSYQRLRDTCAVSWLNAGLPVEHVRRFLGLSSLEATLPYARLAKGTLERRMERVEEQCRRRLNTGPPAPV
jgi:integrase